MHKGIKYIYTPWLRGYIVRCIYEERKRAVYLLKYIGKMGVRISIRAVIRVYSRHQLRNARLTDFSLSRSTTAVYTSLREYMKREIEYIRCVCASDEVRHIDYTAAHRNDVHI